MPRPPVKPLDVMTFIPLWLKYSPNAPRDATLIGFKQGKQEWRATFTSNDYATATFWGNINRTRKWLTEKVEADVA